MEEKVEGIKNREERRSGREEGKWEGIGRGKEGSAHKLKTKNKPNYQVLKFRNNHQATDIPLSSTLKILPSKNTKKKSNPPGGILSKIKDKNRTK